MNAPPCQHSQPKFLSMILGVRGQYKVVARLTGWEEVNNPDAYFGFTEKKDNWSLLFLTCDRCSPMSQSFTNNRLVLFRSEAWLCFLFFKCPSFVPVFVKNES